MCWHQEGEGAQEQQLAQQVLVEVEVALASCWFCSSAADELMPTWPTHPAVGCLHTQPCGSADGL
jgi:hypothetical protein